MDGTSLAAGSLKLIMLCNTLICCRWKISLLQGTLKVFGAEFPGVKILVAPKKISGTVMTNSSHLALLSVPGSYCQVMQISPNLGSSGSINFDFVTNHICFGLILMLKMKNGRTNDQRKW